MTDRRAPGLRVSPARLARFGLIGIIALTAVASPGCRRPARPLTVAPGADLLVRLAAQRARVGPITATFDARLQRSGGWFTTGSVTGVLALQAPDRFRVRLFLPGGLTIQDLTMVGDDYRLALPLEAQERRGRMCFGSAAECEDVGPGLALGWIFTRDLGAHAATSTVATYDDRYVISTRVLASHDVAARLTVLREGFRLVREEMLQAGTLWMRADFDDYRPLTVETGGDIDVPYRIRVADKRNNLSIELQVRKYAVKDGFPEQVFRMERIE
jgi:hypothetical protein